MSHSGQTGHPASTAELAAGVAREAGFSEVRVLKDHEGLPRVVEGRVG